MKIAFFLSSMGGSPLQIGLERGLKELGHHVEDYQNTSVYDLILVFNQASHCPYEYPKFPRDPVPLVFVDSAEYGFSKRHPGVAHAYQNTFSEGALWHETKNQAEQRKLKAFLDGKSFPYFIREYFKFLDFPPSYHPIDYPLYLGSVCPQEPTLDDYVNRKMDLFLSWGISHPWRKNLTALLRACPVRSQVLALEENGTPRMPQQEMFARTRAAKCSVSFDGYGSSSFRLTEVLVRALLLRGPLFIKLREDLTDGVNCVEYGVEGDWSALERCEGFISSDICAKLRWALEDPERAFRIHEAGYHHCMEHWTEKATAAYVLKTVEAHDWKTATPLDL